MFLIAIIACATWLGPGDGSQLGLYKDLTETSRDALARSVAGVLLEGITDRSPSYFEGLLVGMQMVDSGEDLFTDDELRSAMSSYFDLQQAYQGIVNLHASNEYFASIGSDFTCVIPAAVFYRTVAEGSGPILPKSAAVVEMHYQVEPVAGTSTEVGAYVNTFGDRYPKVHRLDDLIPGMSEGMAQMRIGECREIVIHPHLAYGMSGMFEPGVSLKATIKLLAFSGVRDPTRSDVDLIDTNAEQNSISRDEFRRQQWLAGRAEGILCWRHFSQASDLLSLELVIAQMRHGHREKLGVDSDQKHLYSMLQCYLAIASERP